LHGYYLIENGETSFGENIHEIARLLHKRGITKDESIVSNFDDKVFGPMYFFFMGTNCRFKATKARKLGWKPKHSNDIVSTLAADVDYILASENK